MKKLALFIALFIGLSTISFASNGDKNKKSKKAKAEKREFVASIHEYGSPKVAVHFKKDESDKVNITIKNSNNRVVFSETIKKNNSMVKKYELDQLPEGEYQVSISNGYKAFEKTISIE